MSNIRDLLGNATMACTYMDININSKDIVKNILNIIKEDKDDIEKANSIDVENNNGFRIDFDVIDKITIQMSNLEDSYRKVINMGKRDDNYLVGKQTDHIGTVCVVYDGNTYYFIETILKAILTHNSIILASNTNYMQTTNELILLLIRRILEAYKIDKNLIQILYTNEFEELLSNSVSIGKVIVIGNKSFQERIKQISKIEVCTKGYNNFDMYIEDDSNISFINAIVKQGENIDIYVKKGINVPFEDFTEVQDIDEAISMINFNTAGYSSSIFTDNGQNASKFLREVKAQNISVNTSPLIKDTVDIDIGEFLTVKNMLYPSPLKELSDQNRIELDENDNKFVDEMKQKDEEIDNLKKQLFEAQCLANKYMNIFRNSFLSRFFGKLKKQDLEKDTKLLS